MSEKIYILLPVHNRREITRQFVACLKAQTYTNYHLLLIDDGSNDGTADMVLEQIPSATVLRGTGDWWWAGSLQRGIEWLRRQEIDDAQVVLMINDDVSIGERFLEIGLSLLADAGNALVQARIHCSKTSELLDAGVVFDGRTLQFRPPRAGEAINCLTTNGLFMRWGDLQRIGDFHPRMLPHYLSDYEFTLRAHAKGLRLISPPELRLYWSKETTGLRKFDMGISFVEFLKLFFSNKYALNPVHWTAFILLAEHVQRRPYHILRIWVHAGRVILEKAADRSYRLLSGRSE